MKPTDEILKKAATERGRNIDARAPPSLLKMKLKGHHVVLILMILNLQLSICFTLSTALSCSTKCKCYQIDENDVADCEDVEDLKDVSHSISILILTVKSGKPFSINTDTFSPFYNLKELHLTGFMISEIDPLVFKNMKHLVNVDFSNNEIPDVGYLSEILSYCPDLRFVNLKNNPLQCSCSFIETIDFLFKHYVKVYGIVKCERLQSSATWSDIRHSICTDAYNDTSLQSSKTELLILENYYSETEHDEKLSSWQVIKKRETEDQYSNNSAEYIDEFENYTDDRNFHDVKQVEYESSEKATNYSRIQVYQNSQNIFSDSLNVNKSSEKEIITTDYSTEDTLRKKSISIQEEPEDSVSDYTTYNPKILSENVNDPLKRTNSYIQGKTIKDRNEKEFKQTDVQKILWNQLKEKFESNGPQHEYDIKNDDDHINEANDKEYFEGYLGNYQGDSLEDKGLREEDENIKTNEENPNEVGSINEVLVNANENNESANYKTAIVGNEYTMNKNNMNDNVYDTTSEMKGIAEGIFTEQKLLGYRHRKHNRAMPLPIKGDPFTEEDYKEATKQFQSEGSGDTDEYDPIISKFLNNNKTYDSGEIFPLLNVEDEDMNIEEDVTHEDDTNYSKHLKLMLTTDIPHYEDTSTTNKDVKLENSLQSTAHKTDFSSLSTPEYRKVALEGDIHFSFQTDSTFLSTQNEPEYTTPYGDIRQNNSDFSTENDNFDVKKTSEHHSNINSTLKHEEFISRLLVTNENDLQSTELPYNKASAYNASNLSFIIPSTVESVINEKRTTESPTYKFSTVTNKPELKSSLKITHITIPAITTAGYKEQSSDPDYEQKLRELNFEVSKTNVTGIQPNEDKTTSGKSNVAAYVVVGVLVSGFCAIIAFVIIKNRILKNRKRNRYAIWKRKNNPTQDQEMSELRDLEGQGLLSDRGSTIKRPEPMQASFNQNKVEPNTTQKNGYQGISMDHDSDVEQSKYDALSSDLDDIKSISTPSPIVSPLNSSNSNLQAQTPLMSEAGKIRIVESALATMQKADIVIYKK